MLQELESLLALPGRREDQMYLGNRLFMLSVREEYLLTAACTLHPPETAADAIKHLFDLGNYAVYLAGNDEELGRVYLRQMSTFPQDVLPYANLAFLGQLCRSKQQGLFINGCYAAYSPQPERIMFKESRYHRYWDGGWCIRLKLASPSVPQGVWLRLPDPAPDEGAGEVSLACRELKTDCLNTCTLLDFQSLLPEVGNLKLQYSSIEELIEDGNDLGLALDKWTYEIPPALERLAAALKYENCRTLKAALNVIWNLHCYKWVPSEDLEHFAVNALRERKVPEDVVLSGAIDLYSYAEDILEASGYVFVERAGGYVFRDEQNYVHFFDAAAEVQQQTWSGMSMQ